VQQHVVKPGFPLPDTLYGIVNGMTIVQYRVSCLLYFLNSVEKERLLCFTLPKARLLESPRYDYKHLVVALCSSWIQEGLTTKKVL
jgi:hypothetical protein